MSKLLACGINHQTASLALREKLVFSADGLQKPLLSLLNHTQGSEAVILSTCNRTEFYCVNTKPTAIVDWLHKQKQLSMSNIQQAFYVHYDEQAVRHLLRVTSGLDSIMLGETQISSQVKRAFASAAAAGTLGSYLHRLATYVFSITKKVRSDTAIGVHPVSLASAAINLAKHIFADLTQATVMFIGAGEINELIGKYFKTVGVTRFLIANRTLHRAEKLAQQLNGIAIHLAEINHHLPRADIIITATASPVPILGKGMVESAVKLRKHRPMFMVDLSIPRDIEPEIQQLADVYLSTLEDLQAIVAHNIQNREESAKQAEAIIEAQVKHYTGTLRIVEAAPIISAYRKKVESIRDLELVRAKQQLQNGEAVEVVLNRFANNLTNKLLHTPCVQLRQAAYNQQDEVLELAQWLLDI